MTRMTILPESQQNKQSGIPSLGVGFPHVRWRPVETYYKASTLHHDASHMESFRSVTLGPAHVPPKNTQDGSESRIRFPNPFPNPCRSLGFATAAAYTCLRS